MSRSSRIATIVLGVILVVFAITFIIQRFVAHGLPS